MALGQKTEVVTIWTPQPRQALLLSCPVFEVLYGGARGGGKTDAIIGDFCSHASEYDKDAVGLVVRRERTQLMEMIERSKQIYTPLGARFIAQDKMWRFQNGARLTFAYLENDSDADGYQGWNCVGASTLIRMADGSLKQISSIRVGELVMTLAGARRVLKVVKPYWAPCVRATVRRADGTVAGEQVQPVWHPLLSWSGTSGRGAPRTPSMDEAWVAHNGVDKSFNVVLRDLHGKLRDSWWTHPYTGELHKIACPTSIGGVHLKSCTGALVADLCVEDANHYISDTGLINKNTSYVGIEEMGTFPDPKPVMKLMATLRLGGPRVIKKFRATANPGGSGHLWIRQRYIDPAPGGFKILHDTYVNPFTGNSSNIERMFIPSRVTDNIYCNNDQYIAQLQLSAGTRLLHAWLHGDWSVIEGAFFDEWDESKHVIKPFVIPPHWTRFTSADWGSAHPFAVHWWAVVPDDANSDGLFSGYTAGRYDSVPEKMRYQGSLPPGAIVCYREWYGSPNHSNTGLKLHAEDVARGIVERERHEPRNDAGRARISYRVIDPDACKDKGGPTIAERMGYAPNYVYWQPADNMRVGRRGHLGGWDAVRSRLKGDAHGRPMMYFFPNCEDIIRTLPVMQHDPDSPEDVMEGEDHCLDSTRYACMSRPYSSISVPEAPGRTFSIGSGNQLTINDVMDDAPRRKSGCRFERIR